MSVEEVLNRHRSTLLDYAKKHKLNVLDIKEEVISGESIARRPKMLELLQEVEDKKYDAVLVMDIDRLGRGNMREQGLILETFKEYDTKIITPNKTYDLDNEFDEEYSEFEAFMSRRELKIIKKRLLRGRMKSLQEGNYIASVAPFGYEKHGKTLVINNDQAKVVELIFKLYVIDNLGDSRIAKYLIENRIQTASGDLNWDKTTIRSILKNPVYTGKVVWGRKKISYDKRGIKGSKLQDEADWLIYEGKHEAIIDEDTFNTAQAKAKSRHNPRTQANIDLRNPLAGIIKCGGCGHTMTIRTMKNKPDSIRCYKDCGNVKSSYIYLIEDRLMKIVLDELSKMKYSFEYKDIEYNKDAEIQVLLHSKAELIKTRNILLDQKDKLYDLLEQGVYNNDTFLERMNALTGRLQELGEDIVKLEAKVSKIQAYKQKDNILIITIEESIKFIKALYPRLNPKQRNEFLKTIIEKVIYNKHKDAGKYEFNLEVYLKL